MVSESTRGFYSLLRWRTDVGRDESKNIAVIAVAERGAMSDLRPAPVSALSSRLHDQGLLDAAIVALQHEVTSSPPFTLERLTALHEQLDTSLYLTKPKPLAISDFDGAVAALYKALVQPRAGGAQRGSKHAMLDKVVIGLRSGGFDVRRGSYVEDFIFDAVVAKPTGPTGVEVLSFANERKDWAPVERDVGHFLFSLQQLEIRGVAIVNPPNAASQRNAAVPFERVQRWLRRLDVRMIEADPQTGKVDRVALLGAVAS
jgi:hypothetical protein